MKKIMFHIFYDVTNLFVSINTQSSIKLHSINVGSEYRLEFVKSKEKRFELTSLIRNRGSIEINGSISQGNGGSDLSGNILSSSLSLCQEIQNFFN